MKQISPALERRAKGRAGPKERLCPEMGRKELARELARRAERVLLGNDMGDWTKPAPKLYPHQWSWDSAFIAIGLSRLDGRRAARELSTLFARQWSNGKVPHIVFNEEAPLES